MTYRYMWIVNFQQVEFHSSLYCEVLLPETLYRLRPSQERRISKTSVTSSIWSCGQCINWIWNRSILFKNKMLLDIWKISVMNLVWEYRKHLFHINLTKIPRCVFHIVIRIERRVAFNPSSCKSKATSTTILTTYYLLVISSKCSH